MIRDVKTKALLNDNVTELNKYKLDRNMCRKIEALSKELIEVRETLADVLKRIEKH